MNRQEMLNKREDVIDKCILFKKEVTVRGKQEFTEKGPCKRIDGKKCAAYISPTARWKLGDCCLATHLIHTEEEKKFINPLKASKKSSKKQKG